MDKQEQPIDNTKQPSIEPSVQPPIQTPIISSPKKSQKALVPMLVVVVVILIAISVALIFLLVNSSNDENNSQSSNPTITESSDDKEDVAQTTLFDPGVALSLITSSLESEYMGVVSSDKDVAPSIVVYDDANDRWYVARTEAAWSAYIEFDEATGNSDPYNDAVSTLKARGLTEPHPDKQFSTGYDGQDKASYLSDIVFSCTIKATEGVYLRISCARNKDIDSQIAEMKPFYDAYEAHHNQDAGESEPFIIGIDLDDIKVSDEYTEYETVYGNVSFPLSGAILRFYKKDSGVWTYAHGGHNSPVCNEITDIDAQKAFSTFACYDSDNSETTFKEYYDL